MAELSYYEAWSYKKKKHKKIKAYKKYVQKEPRVKRCLLITGLKPESQLKQQHDQNFSKEGKPLYNKNTCI